MDRILIILKKENGPRALSALTLGLNTIILKHGYWYTYICSRSQVSVYRTIGPLVCFLMLRLIPKLKFLPRGLKARSDKTPKHHE